MLARCLRTSVLVSGLLAFAGPVQAYPGGTPAFVTDVAPFCAGCHSSVSEAQLAGVPVARVQAELVANKHIAKIRDAGEDSPYAQLTEAQREELIAGVQAIDANSAVRVLAPSKLEPGAVFEVTVEAKGGGGPVVGLALVDSDQRWQARPAPSAGWHVIEKPRVIGPDGQEQTRFTDGRHPSLAPGIAYVNVYDVKADPAAGSYSKVSMTLRLRAPKEPGTYPLAAVFLYGTEKASPHGAVEASLGRILPRGGYTGNSGRVRFSDVLQIQVGSTAGGD